MDFQSLMKIEFCWRIILKILITHKPSMGPCEVPHKVWARFDVYLIQTNTQTPRQAKYIDRPSFRTIFKVLIFFCKNIKDVYMPSPNS